jgi:glycosyltransferase involved in cell wall biosynthesis
VKLSVITPTHDVSKLAEAWVSLRDQTHEDFEWVVVPNKNGLSAPLAAKIHALVDGDARVRIVEHAAFSGVGAAKKFAFDLGVGEALVELDHDDILMPTALEEVAKAFEDPAVGFVYSDAADFQDGSLSQGDVTYLRDDTRPGWVANGFTFRTETIGGIRPGTYEMPNAFPPTAAALALIFYAPNHVRAWRRSVYQEIGGHNAELPVADDHELMLRTYLATRMKHIPKLLYLYRVTGGNTWLKNVNTIRDLTFKLRDEYLERLVLRECELLGMPTYDLGGGIDPREGWLPVDKKLHALYEHIGVQADLTGRWPFEDNSVGAFRAHDLLEHLPDKMHTMREIHRCLRPGGWLLSMTPSTDGRGAFQDPTHCCHSDDTEVLTADGFKLFTELTGEEMIYAYDAVSKTAVTRRCLKIHSYDHDGEMIHFTGRSVDALVTPDHRMFIGSSDDVTAFKFQKAEDMLPMKSARRMPSTAIFDGDSPEYFEIPGSRLKLASNPDGRFVGDTVRLPMIPFMEFMGWFISEGWTTSKDNSVGGRHNFYRIGISQSETANPDKYRKIGDCIASLGYKPARTKNGWVFNDKHFALWLAQLGHSHDKYIPTALKQMHPSLLTLMLDAACLGDGTPNGAGRTYASSSPRLASDIQEIAIKCGFKTTMSRDNRIGKPVACNPDYRANYDIHLVYISRPKETYLTKAARTHYKGRVLCVTVEQDNVILTRRNGRVIWSGNSYWNSNCFWYWTRREQARYIGNADVRFQAAQLDNVTPSAWHAENNIPYVRANLVALKGDYEGPGEKGI